jgi:hypothetical protein
MNKQMQSSARNRSSVRLRWRFMIIGPSKQAFYPKATKIVNTFTLCFSPATYRFAVLGRDNTFVPMASDAAPDAGSTEEILLVSQQQSP